MANGATPEKAKDYKPQRRNHMEPSRAGRPQRKHAEECHVENEQHQQGKVHAYHNPTQTGTHLAQELSRNDSHHFYPTSTHAAAATTTIALLHTHARAQHLHVEPLSPPCPLAAMETTPGPEAPPSGTGMRSAPAQCKPQSRVRPSGSGNKQSSKPAKACQGTEN